MQVIYTLFDFNKKICYNLFGGTFLIPNISIDGRCISRLSNFFIKIFCKLDKEKLDIFLFAFGTNTEGI